MATARKSAFAPLPPSTSCLTSVDNGGFGFYRAPMDPLFGKPLSDLVQEPHFREVVNECFATCYRIYVTKGDDYARGRADEDRLDNFRQASQHLAITFAQAWGVYFYKHVAAVWKFVRDGRVESEPIEQRLYDIINYSVLLLLWVKEEKARAPSPSHDESQDGQRYGAA